MLRKSVKGKIILPAILVLVALLLIITIDFAYNFDKYTEVLFEEKISVTAQSFKKYLENCEQISRIAAIAASRDISVVEAVSKRDSASLRELLMDSLDDYTVDFFVVTDENGIVLTRTHNEVILDAIHDHGCVQRALSGDVHTCIREGTYIKVSVRTDSPIYDSEGVLIGVVSAGVRLDTNEALDHLKERFDAEFTVALGDTRIATTFELEGERFVGTKVSPQIAKAVLEDGEEYYGKSEYLGENYKAYYMPLRDHNGETFAMVFVGKSNINLITGRNAIINNGIMTGILGLFVAVIMLWFIISKITKPIKRAAHLVSEVTNGSFDIDEDKGAVSRDEIGVLTADIHSLVDVVKSLTEELSQLTSDLNIYGDIDYTIDTDKYSGVYKEIIGGIKTLADSISMMKKAVAVMDYLDTMISVVDLEYNLLYVNKSLADRYGVDKESCLGQKCYRAIRGMDEPCPVCQLPKILPEIASYPVLAYHSEWDSCAGIWLGGRAAVINWIDGSQVFLNSVYDETQVKDYEIKLSEAAAETRNTLLMNELQLERLRVVVNASKLGLWEVTVAHDEPADPANAYMWSDEFRHMLGFSDETEFPNKLDSWSARLHPDDREKVITAYKNHIIDKTGNTPYDSEYRLQKKNGEYAYFHTAGETARDENGNALRVIGALKDITESKNVLHEIEKRRMEAEAANQAKSSFVANISHEIRTPMNSIMGFSELALDDDISPKTRESLSSINNNAKWLLQIINDILDLSKIESGNMELENIPFDLQELIASCESLISPRAMEKNLELYFYAEPSVRKKLCGDPLRLRQVLVNLLSNSVKFTDAGVVSLFICVDSATETSAALRFEIKDTGIGLAPDQIARIFEPFMQADVSTTRKYGGTGLGLTITNNILKMMGSRLEIESSPGNGCKASFTVKFDVADEADEVFEKVSAAHGLEKPLFKGVVLVCEDNVMNQRVIVEHLKKVGLGAEIAANGRVGIDKVQKRIDNGEKPFDLIFMDIHMPEMDGIEATPKINELNTGTPIVAMTANIMAQDVDRYRKFGMSDHIGKPYTSQELWHCLLRHLRPVGYAARETACRGEDEFQHQLKAEFARSNLTKFEEIEKAIASGDIKLAHRLAHTLKSSAGLIGKTSLQAVAADVEYALVNNTCLVTGAQMTLLEKELCSVLEELGPPLDKAVSPVRQDTLNVEQTLALFDVLEPMLKNRNPVVLNFLDAVRSVPGAETLAQRIEDYEFKGAIITLNELKRNWM